MDKAPCTLQEAVIFYSDYVNCHQFMVELRWGTNGPVRCPRCGSENVSYLPNAKVFKCYEKHEKQKFSLKVGTIFEDSPIALEKWLPVMWLLANSKNGVSSWEIHRSLGVTQKTAWFMLQRGRLATQDGHHGGKIGGEGCEIEIDETFIGGKARNMHKADKVRKMQGKCGGADAGNKTIVMGMLERRGTVRTKVISDRKKKTMAPIIREHVEPKSQLMTDDFQTGWWTPEEFEHQAVNHLESYVQGNCHTNGMENFWALLKRGIHGTFRSNLITCSGT